MLISTVWWLGRVRGWINDDSSLVLSRFRNWYHANWLETLGNKWYYLRSSGAMATGWYQEGSTWYYLDLKMAI